MKFYYNPKSQSLKSLSLEKKTAIKSYFSDPQELKKRNCDKKYGITRAGQHLPLYGLEDGIGAERGRTRVLFTLWKGNIILLDYVTSHDYHKAPSMDRSYFSRFFATLQDGEPTLEALEELPMSPENSPVLWQPIGFDKNEQLIIPSEQQACVVADQRYPMIIEGPAGSGKTFVLSMLCEHLSQQEPSSLSQETKGQVFYLYPNDASLLGAHMQQYWAECYLTGDQALASGWDFHTQPVDDSLPEPLKEPSIKGLEKHIEQLLIKRKNDLLNQKKTKAKLEAKALWDAWALLNDSGISASLLTQYMVSLAVFRNYLGTTFRLKDLFSSRAGIGDLMFDAFETVYQDDIALAPWFAPLLQVFTCKADRLFDMLVIDEAQNISFAALAYLAWHTKEHRVIYSGDRDQAGHWESLSSLHLINLLLTQRGVMSKEQNKQLSEHYRCPAEVWEYTQHTLLPLREQLFGREYQRSPSPPQAEKSPSYALSYLRACEKNMGALQEFFAPIPEMSRDCFVIVANVEKFEKFALEYLGGKKFIVLTPNQIAGLEAKLVVAFDLLDFDNIHKIGRGGKTKRRLMKLSPEEETAYQQFNLFHVALTRSTEATLIIETKNNTRYQAHQHLFKSLRAPITGHAITYLSASPQELLSLYHQMASKSASAAQEFYQRYGHMFEALLKPQVEEALPLKSEVQVPQAVTEMPIQDTIEMLAKKSSSWDESLPNLDAATIARLLFTAYGKKRSSTKTLFEKLAEQLDKQEKISSAAKKAKNLTTEQIVWAKFLNSDAYKKYINEDFYQIALPESGLTVGNWVSLFPRTPSYTQLKKELGLSDQSFQLITQKKPRGSKNSTSRLGDITGKIEDQRTYSIKGKSCELTLSPLGDHVPAPALAQMVELRKSLIRDIINHDDFKEEIATIQLYVDTARYIKYYQHMDHHKDKSAGCKNLEELIKKECVIDARFWKTLTTTKYAFLREQVNNEMLFFKWEKQRWVLDKELMQEVFISITNDFLPHYEDDNIAYAQDLLKESLKGILILLKHYRSYINEHAIAHEDKPLIIMLHEMTPHILDHLPGTDLKNYLQFDPFWDNKSLKEKQQAFKRYVTEMRISANPCNILRVLKELAPSFEVPHLKIFDDIDAKVDSQLYVMMISSDPVLPYHYAHIQFFINYYGASLSWKINERVRKKFDDVIKQYCIDSPDFWKSLTPEKYHFLKEVTGHKQLFWEKNQSPWWWQLACYFSHSVLFDPSMLRQALNSMKKKIIDECGAVAQTDIWFQVIKNGLCTVLSDYQNALQQNRVDWYLHGAPLIVILWRFYPAIEQELSKEQFILLMEQDIYWDEPGSRGAFSILFEVVHRTKNLGSPLEQALVVIQQKQSPGLYLDYQQNQKQYDERLNLARTILNTASTTKMINNPQDMPQPLPAPILQSVPAESPKREKKLGLK